VQSDGFAPPSTANGLLFPSRDRRFDQIVRALSEPNAGPGSDNLMTNEDSFTRICTSIDRQVAPGGVYIGVGPDQNFTYVAHARPALAFIVDYRRRNLLLHLYHQALFALSKDRAAYLSRLTARRPKSLPAADATAEALVSAFENAPMDRALLDATAADVTRFLQPLNLVADAEWADLATIGAKLAGPGMSARFLALPSYPTLGRLAVAGGHMLASESLYQRVRSRQLSGRIIPLVGDLAGTSAMPALAAWLRAQGLQVAMIYLSDVEFFLLRDGKFARFLENLQRIPWAEGALLARSTSRKLEHPERVAGDVGTTVLRPVQPFLREARAGRIQNVEDLFR
jgi:hypothetical protein